MTQRQLNLAVARRTGESLRTIRSIGFALLTAPPATAAPADLHLAVACPRCGVSRALPCDHHGPAVMGECVPCDLLFEFRPGDVHIES